MALFQILKDLLLRSFSLRSYLIFSFLFLTLTSCFPSGGEGSEAGGSPFGFALPFIMIFVLFYFLILRPQQKQSSKRDQMLEALKRGDKVITSGGIYGRIINLENEIVTLEIAKGVNIQISKASVSGKVDSEKTESKSKGGKK